jgi:heme/copper-type cytochrome/quinol oxidase subunit 2
MDKKIVVFGFVLVAVFALAFIGVSSIDRNMNGNAVAESENADRPVKEFVMTSFTEVIDGEYFPQYSMKEINVNKGDLVRIKVTVTSGTHDFKIDEFDVFAETPLDEEVVIEFIADEAGSFEYYCTKPNHRKNLVVYFIYLEDFLV